MEKLAGFIHSHSRLIIVMVILLNLVALASFYRFSLDTDFLSFFSGGNPEAQEFDQLKEKYDTGDTISILIEDDSSLLDAENLRNVFGLKQEISGIEGVSLVQSFLPSEVLTGGDQITVDEQFIDQNPDSLSDFIQNQYFLADHFLSPDERVGIIVATLEVDADAGKVVDLLKDIKDSQEALDLSLTGDEVIKDTLWHSLLKVLLLLPCAVLLILLVFFAILRNIKYVILSFIPAAFAALWTFGAIFWSGKELDMVTVISPIFIIVIGCAFGLHYISHFIENSHRYSDRRELISQTLQMAGVPIAIAALTTMAGFTSLTWTDLDPLRDMGIFVAVGVGFAGIISLIFVPAVLCRVKKLPSTSSRAKTSRLSKIVLAASRQRAMIIGVFLAIVIAGAVFIPQIGVISDQLMFFKDDSEIRQNFTVVEENFGDASPLIGEIVCESPETALSDSEYAAEVLSIEREMENLPGIKSVFSIFDMLQGVNRMMTGTDAYPENPQMVLAMLGQATDPGMWISGDGVRVTIKTQDFESDEMDELEAFVDDEPGVRAVSGMPLLLDEMNTMMVRTQVQSLGLAFALIFIMLLITLRKFRGALVGLLPVGITIVAVLGMLSITNFNLNIMTATLSAICVGAGVDYSVHVISGIHYFRKQGQGRREAVDSMISSVSMPILGDALGITIGLSVLFFSPLKLHMQAATIMWVAMIVAAAAALLVIPLFYAGRDRGQKEHEED